MSDNSDTERLRWVLAHPLKFAVVMGSMWRGDSTAVSLEDGRTALDKVMREAPDHA